MDLSALGGEEALEGPMAALAAGADMESVEDYMVWRQHVGDMYALLREKKLDAESLTFDWLPDDLAVMANFEEDATKIMVVRPEASVDPIWEYATPSEVNRARVLVRDEKIYIAAITADGLVLVFDYKGDRAPLELRAHTDNGFALCWSKDGLLATGDDSRRVAIWNIDFDAWTFTMVESTIEFEPVEGENKGVNDLTWIGDQLVAACDDEYIRVLSKSLEINGKYPSQQGKVDCLAPNPFSANMFATGGSAHTIAIWDIRELDQPLHIMAGHEKTIASIKFSPVVDGLLASAGEDRRVVVWDIRNIGITQDPEEAEEGLPEIAFTHGGHIMMVNDLSWHPTRPWVLASVSEDRSVQIWKPNELVTNEAQVPKLELDAPRKRVKLDFAETKLGAEPQTEPETKLETKPENKSENGAAEIEIPDESAAGAVSLPNTNGNEQSGTVPTEQSTKATESETISETIAMESVPATEAPPLADSLPTTEATATEPTNEQ